jgi:hypothetical protein
MTSSEAKRGPVALNDLLKVAEDLARQRGEDVKADVIRTLYAPTSRRADDDKLAMLWIVDKVYEMSMQAHADQTDLHPVQLAELFVMQERWRVMVEPEQRPEGAGYMLIPFVRKNGSTFTRWMRELPPNWVEARLPYCTRIFDQGQDPIGPTAGTVDRVVYHRSSRPGPPWYEER